MEALSFGISGVFDRHYHSNPQITTVEFPAIALAPRVADAR